jgi:hypothetical protein
LEKNAFTRIRSNWKKSRDIQLELPQNISECAEKVLAPAFISPWLENLGGKGRHNVLYNQK